MNVVWSNLGRENAGSFQRAGGRLLMPDGKVVDLYRDWLASAKPQEPNENPFSIGLRFEYGKFRFYTAGA